MTTHRNAVRSLTSSGPQLAVDLSTAWDDFEVANKRKAMLFGYQRTLNGPGRWAGIIDERSSTSAELPSNHSETSPRASDITEASNYMMLKAAGDDLAISFSISPVWAKAQS